MAALNKNITVRLRADASNFNASIKAAGANAQQLAEGMEQSGRKTSLLTTGLAAAGMAAGALGVAAIKTASDFDASMSGVQSVTRASAAEMDLLRQAALDAGASTVYSASEAADGINELGKAGLSTSDILNGGLSGALDLAASEGMDVGEAAELMSTALAQFNLSGDRATDVADALAAGAGNASGSAHDLGMALAQAGTVANSYGVSMEETVGALSAFAKAGMIGSDAGTSLKSMLQMLGNPTDKAKQLMDQLGLSVYDAQGNFIGLAGLAGQLQKSMSGLSQEQRNAALATIFGSDAVRAANVLYSEGADGIADWTDTVSQSGYAAEMAAARTDNLKGDLEQLSGSVETLLINLGEGGQGPLRSLVQTLDTLVEAFSSLPAPVQQTAVLAVAAVGGFTALHKALTPLNTSASKTAQAFGLMIDPGQRLITALPQLKSGFQQLGQAAAGTDPGMGLMNNGLTRGQTAMNGLKSIGGGLVSFLGGPWGIAFSAAGSAVMYLAKQQQEAQQRTESYEQAIRATGDATQQMVEDLTSRGIGSDIPILDWFQETSVGAKTFTELLDDVGIELSTFVSAAKGDADALDEVNGVIDELGKGHGQAASQAATLQRALDEESDAFAKAKSNAALQDETMKQLNESSGEAAGSTGELAGEVSDLGDEAADANEQLGNLIDGVLGFADASIGVESSQLQLTQTIQDATDTIAKNGQTLDENTEAGRENQQALLDIANQAVSTADAIMKKGEADGDMTTAAFDAAEAIQKGRDALVQQATQADMSQDAAEAYANSLGLIPEDVWTQIDNNAPLSREAVESYLDTLALTPEEKNTFMNAIDNGATLTIKNIQDYIALTPSEKTTYLNAIANTNSAYNAIMAVANARYTATIFVRSQMTDLNGNASGNGRMGTFADGGLIGYANGGLLSLANGDGYSGLIHGWGGKKADVMPIMASRGEFMQQASAVDYYGVDAMRALNERKIPREWLAGPQMVNGGSVDNRSYNVTLQVVGTPDPEVTARKTFEIFQREVRRLS